MIEPNGLRAALVKLKQRAEHRARRPRAGTTAAWVAQADEIDALLKQLAQPPARCPSLAFRGEQCKRAPGHQGGCQPRDRRAEDARQGKAGGLP